MVIINAKGNPKLICANFDRFEISDKEVYIYQNGNVVFIGALQPLDDEVEVKEALIDAMRGLIVEFKEV